MFFSDRVSDVARNHRRRFLWGPVTSALEICDFTAGKSTTESFEIRAEPITSVMRLRSQISKRFFLKSNMALINVANIPR